MVGKSQSRWCRCCEPPLCWTRLRRKSGNSVRRRWLLYGIFVRQLLPMHGNRRPDPKRVCKMIPPRIRCVWMNQNAQCSMIEHQPWNQGRKHLRGKGDLKHRLIMRSHFHVMPASQGDGKALTHPTAKLLGLRTRRRRIVIDVGVIARDFVYRSRCQHFRRISQLRTFFSLLSYFSLFSYRARGPKTPPITSINSAFDGGTVVNPGRQGHDPRRRSAAGVPRVLEEFVHPGSQDISKNTQVKSKSRELLQTT